MKLLDFAYSTGLSATDTFTQRERKALGQYLTPPQIAEFMAGRCIPQHIKSNIKILDPSAGSGILAAAIIDKLFESEQRPNSINLTLYEIDDRFIPSLRKLADRMHDNAKKRNIAISISIRNQDFLLSPVALSGKPTFDIVIANPPYFKISSSDSRSIAHQYAVYGQPNIYGLFMASCARLMFEDGKWCFISPRSWTNGLYFSAIRHSMFRHLNIDALHIFESRRDHFANDDILQEAIITWATAKAKHNHEVIVSTSEGLHDIEKSRLKNFPINKVISQNEVIIAPDDNINICTSTLNSFGLKISTGPVVAFRAANYLKEHASNNTVPLLWMQHIHPMQIKWPLNKKKEHIIANGKTAWMLVPNKNMVIMRRFSPKEDKRRVISSPYISNSLKGPAIGLENHTNYIYRPGGELSISETIGLSAYLNSYFVDQYFRIICGNTQINATDMRKLPLPPIELIIEIGNKLQTYELSDIDNIAKEVLTPSSNFPIAM